MSYNAQAVLIDAQAAVDVLIAQYHHDLTLVAQSNAIKSERMAVAARISKEQGLPLRDVLADRSSYPAFAALTTEGDAIKTGQQALWDKMFYANPVIWLMYKYQAYKGNNELSTLRDLKKHCGPRDYICTKRFHFLNTYLLAKGEATLTDTTHYPNDTKLPTLYGLPVILGLVGDNIFMRQWMQYEFHQVSGRVAKWENYSLGL